jgi:hypothetical protein
MTEQDIVEPTPGQAKGWGGQGDAACAVRRVKREVGDVVAIK